MSIHISRTNDRENVPPGAGQQLYDLANELQVPLIVALIPTDAPCDCGNPEHTQMPALMIRVAEGLVTPDIAIGLLLKAIEAIQVAHSVSKRVNR